MAKLQYTTKDAVTEFITKFDDWCTSAILEDEGVISMLDGKPPENVIDEKNPLGTVECFLQLFTDREDYELCQIMIEQYPELRIDNC